MFEVDSWPVKPDERPARATGIACSVAIGLMENAASGMNGRIMFFSAGAASSGPGKIVSNQLEETIRSHHDLFKGNCQWLSSFKVLFIFNRLMLGMTKLVNTIRAWRIDLLPVVILSTSLLAL